MDKYLRILGENKKGSGTTCDVFRVQNGCRFSLQRKTSTEEEING